MSQQPNQCTQDNENEPLLPMPELSQRSCAQHPSQDQTQIASPRSFTFFSGPICFSHPNGFSTGHRLLRLIS